MHERTRKLELTVNSESQSNARRGGATKRAWLFTGLVFAALVTWLLLAFYLVPSLFVSAFAQLPPDIALAFGLLWSWGRMLNWYSNAGKS